MVLNVVDSYTIRKITVYSSFTCVYVPIAILILIYTDNLYNIGKANTFKLLAGLFVAECVKVIIVLYMNSTKDQKSKVKRYYSKLKLKEVFRCFCIVGIVTALLDAVSVLFGAPLFSDQEETLLLSLLVSVFTVIPSCLNLGADVTLSLLIGNKPLAGDLMQEMMSRAIKCTLLGVWLGAVVIPLDWDRPWQAWPVPCSLGTFVGYIFSHILTLVKLMPNIVKLFSNSYGRNQ